MRQDVIHDFYRSLILPFWISFMLLVPYSTDAGSTLNNYLKIENNWLDTALSLNHQQFCATSDSTKNVYNQVDPALSFNSIPWHTLSLFDSIKLAQNSLKTLLSTQISILESSCLISYFAEEKPQPS